MGRPSTIDEAALFAAIGRMIASDGAVAMQKIVEQTGVSTGSIYHRYQSREGLMAHAWFDALAAFQAEFQAVIAGVADAPDRAAVLALGERAALVTPRFARRQHERALVLACGREAQFLANRSRSDLANACRARNQAMAKALKVLAQRLGAGDDSAQLGVVQFPLAVVRHYLPKRKVPRSAEKHVAAAYRAALSV